MGKFAQYRKRGQARTPSSGLAPPPAPILESETPDLTQTATGLTDSLGNIRLYYSLLVGGPFLLTWEELWTDYYNWDDSHELSNGYYYATEVGNGTTYAGESAPSNTVEYVS